MVNIKIVFTLVVLVPLSFQIWAKTGFPSRAATTTTRKQSTSILVNRNTLYANPKQP